MTIGPFRVDAPQSAIDALRNRLSATRRAQAIRSFVRPWREARA